MLVKISHGDKATINIGNYENVNPMYNLSVEIDKETVTTEEIETELARIKQIVDTHLQRDIDAIKNTVPPNLRVDEIDGVKYLHVTSAITPVTPDIPHIEEHAALGTALDTLAKSIIDGTEVVISPPQTPNVKTTWDELKTAFAKWVIDHSEDVVFTAHSIKGINSVYRYIGELDAVGMYKGSPAIFDFKKTAKVNAELRDKYFMQMAAYAHFDNTTSSVDFPEYLVIVSPFNEPIITTDIQKYWEMFLQTLARTQERYKL